MPARGLSQRLEHDRVDGVVALDALLEILDARPGGKGVVAELREPFVDFCAQVAVEWQPFLARRPAEEAVMQRVDATQLVDRLWVIVDPEIEDDVRELRVPTVSFDDEERCRLLAAAVAAGELRGRETLEQPELEPLPGRRFEGRRECVHRFPADEDVALRGIARPCAMAGPVEALGAGERRRPAEAVDDAYLAFVPAVVGADERLYDLLGAELPPEQLEPSGP